MMQKLTASLTWGVLLGLVAFFVIGQVGFAKSEKPAAKVAVAAKASVKAASAKAAPVKAKKTPTRSSDHGIPPVMIGLYIFMLAIFVGFELISKVPPLLHSPLMSGSNAISGITIVGALVSAGTGTLSSFGAVLGFFAVIFAMINVVGGFLVTDRMLQMYLTKK